MQKTALFYMANAYPEIGRMADFYNNGNIEAAHNAKMRAERVVNDILNAEDISPAGREEWSTIKNLIMGYEHLGDYEKKVLEKYAEPFSFKFMNSYASSN